MDKNIQTEDILENNFIESLHSYKISVYNIEILKTILLFMVIYFRNEIEPIIHFIVPVFIIFDILMYSWTKMYILYIKEGRKMIKEYIEEYVEKYKE